MKPAIIYIGASEPQRPGIEAIRAAGLLSVVTDVDPDASCRDGADRFLQISATDVPALLDLARSVSASVGLVGVYAVADYAAAAAGAIADEFGLPIGSTEEMALMANKVASSDIFRAHGISVPAEIKIGPAQAIDLANAADLVRFDGAVVVKPSDSFNHRGVTVISDRNLLATDLSPAIERASVESKTVILQEYVEGTHYNIDLLVINDVCHRVSITERFFLDGPGTPALSGVEVDDANGAEWEGLWRTAEQVVVALKRSNGPTTVDVIVTESDVVVLEASPHFHSIMNCHLGGKSAIGSWFRWLAGRRDWAEPMRPVGTGGRTIGHFYAYSRDGGVAFEAFDPVSNLGEGVSACRVLWLTKGITGASTNGSPVLTAVIFLAAANRDAFLAASGAIRQNSKFGLV